MQLPREIGKIGEPAALVCPDCGGSISVRAEGDVGYLVFFCQVGHTYSSASLIAGKEERLEQVLWSTVYLIEELTGLLSDLVGRGGPDGTTPSWPAARDRIERLHRQVKQVRAVLDENDPIELGPDATPDRNPE